MSWRAMTLAPRVTARSPALTADNPSVSASASVSSSDSTGLPEDLPDRLRSREGAQEAPGIVLGSGGPEVAGSRRNEARGAVPADGCGNLGNGDPWGLAPEEAVEPKRNTKRPASRRVPESWQPTEEHREIARTEVRDFDRELAKFRDCEFKTPHKDWDAVFRNWLRSDYGRTGPNARFPRRENFNAPRSGEGWKPNVV